MANAMMLAMMLGVSSRAVVAEKHTRSQGKIDLKVYTVRLIMVEQSLFQSLNIQTPLRRLETADQFQRVMF